MKHARQQSGNPSPIASPEGDAAAERGFVTDDEQKKTGMLKQAEADQKRLAAALAREKLRKGVYREFGPVQLPSEIPLAAIRKARVKGMERFRRELEAEKARISAMEPPRPPRRRAALDFFSGDFLQEIRMHLGKRLRRAATTRDISLLPYFDWRLAGLVTGARDQAGCEVCWALAAVEAFESRLMHNANRLRVFNNREITYLTQIALSVQDVLDGVTDGKCLGGNHTDAFDYFVTKGARLLDFNLQGTEPDFARESLGRKSRRTNNKRIKALAWDFVFERNPLIVPRSDAAVAKMKRALIDHGPLVVHFTIDQNGKFKSYRKGVYAVDAPAKVNHIVLLTGWDDAKRAWIIVNCYGRRWGQSCIDLLKVKKHFPFMLHNAKNTLRFQRGCAYVRWGVSNIGKMASWIETPLVNRESLERLSTVKKAGKRGA